MKAVSLKVFVEMHEKSGEPFFEDLLAEPLGGSSFRLLRSPGFLGGFAAEDECEYDNKTGKLTLLKRGGNVNVQYFREGPISEVEEFAHRRLGELGGRVDGSYRDRLLIITVPVAVGFPRIEAILKEMEATFPGSGWSFANVYDPRDGLTPLNWWKL